MLIGVQYFVPKANSFGYVTMAAVLSFFTLVFSMAATFVGSIVLYRDKVIAKVKPNLFWVVMLGYGLLVHLSWIVRTQRYSFKFWR